MYTFVSVAVATFNVSEVIKENLILEATEDVLI